jgi:hypothetical protein
VTCCSSIWQAMRKSSCEWHRPARRCVANVRERLVDRDCAYALAKKNDQNRNRSSVLALRVRDRLQNRWKLVEHLTREYNPRCGHGQAGNAQRLGSPCVASMPEVIRSGGGVEDALRVRADSNTTWRPLLIRGQVVPQKLRQTLDALLRRRDRKSIGNPEDRLGRSLERYDEHDCWSRSGRPQQIRDARILSHVIVACAPAEHQVPSGWKGRLQSRQRTAYLRHGQPELRMPAAGDDVDDFVT